MLKWEGSARGVEISLHLEMLVNFTSLHFFQGVTCLETHVRHEPFGRL